MRLELDLGPLDGAYLSAMPAAWERWAAYWAPFHPGVRELLSVLSDLAMHELQRRVDRPQEPGIHVLKIDLSGPSDAELMALSDWIRLRLEGISPKLTRIIRLPMVVFEHELARRGARRPAVGASEVN